ncbi:MAG: DUF2490 domain-containing protein [Candidatus Omnitrophica bacterium]|nr:DUF2490 domain-containing protein [Candidatus Omnitrophota bacterium]MDD5352157.1 DUF2490 domain-containing protein [Candidatus Omnitrophota bacterium]MDD5549755.1 DUF2490 domain-containing protein [Candidatus Omnitrophota bacterium]
MCQATKYILLILIFLSIANTGFAQRDWEYWTQESFSIPIKEGINLLVLPEWKFKDDMHDIYQFKLENGISFKVNDYFDITPYYVYQEKKSRNMWDRSDLVYLDGTFKVPLKNFFNLKFSNRLRYQYDFDKAKTTWRNTVKISKALKAGKLDVEPYFSEEPFYDAKLNRITEHRTTVGINCPISKNISLAVGYMLDSKKGGAKWSYANVLASNLNIKF